MLSPFGNWLQFLGGTLGQLAFAVATFWYFRHEEKPFDASVNLFRVDVSLMNVAHNRANAKTQTLSLVDGGIHDWR